MEVHTTGGKTRTNGERTLRDHGSKLGWGRGCGARRTGGGGPRDASELGSCGLVFLKFKEKSVVVRYLLKVLFHFWSSRIMIFLRSCIQHVDISFFSGSFFLNLD
jgi:hypothetical protein